MRAVVKPRLPMFLVTAGFSERANSMGGRAILPIVKFPAGARVAVEIRSRLVLVLHRGLS